MKRWTVKQILKELRDPANRRGSTCTYLIADGEFVKIGLATSPRDRVSTLQIGNPRKLQLLGYALGDHEFLLHEIFAEHRVRGEWFHLTDDLKKLGDALGKDNVKAAIRISAQAGARMMKWLSTKPDLDRSSEKNSGQS